MTSSFTYVIFIRATAAETWNAFLAPEMSRQYWYESIKESTWQPGAPWVMKTAGDLMTDSGIVQEVELHKKLMFIWRCEFMEDLKSEGFATLLYLHNKMFRKQFVMENLI